MGTELERELADIRREVIEGRNLVIRTDNLLKTLHSEMKGVRGAAEGVRAAADALLGRGVRAVRAARRNRGPAVLSGARTSAANGERDKAVAELKTLTRSVEKERAEQAAVAAAHRSAGEAYRMMTELPGDRRLEGVTALAKVDQSKLDPLERQALADRAAALRRELGQTAFERGKEAFRSKEWAAAADELSRFLTMQPSESEQLEASFRLGNALVRQRKYEPAIAPLKTFVEKDRRSKNREWAMTLLAQAYEQTGKPDQAAAVAREALAMYPASQFTPMLKARLSASRRALSSAEGADAGVAAGPAGDATPAVAGAQPTAARNRNPWRRRNRGPSRPPRGVQDGRRVVRGSPAAPSGARAGAPRPALTQQAP